MNICSFSIRDKLLHYVLNFHHQEGQHKARVFKSALNIEKSNYHLLETELILALERSIDNNSLILLETTQYGQKYRLNFSMQHCDKYAPICSIWMHRTDEPCVRLVTCYIDI
jgi:hypothetical protein